MPEADAIVAAVKECLESPIYQGKTFGIISLLGDYQARHIESKLLRAVGPEAMTASRLICGDAYAFQGDERDIIFLSLVAAPTESGIHPLVGDNHERRFNVAASRARDQLWLFHTPTLEDLKNKEDLRYKLLSFFYTPSDSLVANLGVDIDELMRRRSDPNAEAPNPFDSWFEVDVFSELVKRGFRTIPQYPIAGLSIDLMVEGERSRLAVECDGDRWHGADRYEADTARQRRLERCGQTFWRIRGSEFYFDRERSLNSLWRRLEDMGIGPVTESVHPRNTNGKPERLANEPLHDSGNYESLTPSREELIQEIVGSLTTSGPILRSDVIKIAARSLKEKGKIQYQRLREDGEVWNQFKSAINAAIRRGLIDGDFRTIWKLPAS